MARPEQSHYDVQDRQYCKLVNPIAFRMAKTLWSFGHSECNRVKIPTKRGVHLIVSLMANQPVWL